MWLHGLVLDWTTLDWSVAFPWRQWPLFTVSDWTGLISEYTYYSILGLGVLCCIRKPPPFPQSHLAVPYKTEPAVQLKTSPGRGAVWKGQATATEASRTLGIGDR